MLNFLKKCTIKSKRTGKDGKQFNAPLEKLKVGRPLRRTFKSTKGFLRIWMSLPLRRLPARESRV